MVSASNSILTVLPGRQGISVSAAKEPGPNSNASPATCGPAPHSVLTTAFQAGLEKLMSSAICSTATAAVRQQKAATKIRIFFIGSRFLSVI